MSTSERRETLQDLYDVDTRRVHGREVYNFD